MEGRLRVVGISGRMKSGKDFTANYISELFLNDLKRYNIEGAVYIESFANPLKNMLINTFGFKHDDFYTQEGKAKYNELWGMTHREILQRTGTDAIRNNLHPDAWGFAMKNRLAEIKKKEGNKHILVLIPDVRFVSECKVIKEMNGNIIYIDRPYLVTTKMKIMEALHLVHPSEQPIPKRYRDFEIINNSSLDALKWKIKEIYEREELVFF